MRLAESFQEAFPNAPPPYAQASRRLIAALAERCGNADEAVTMNSAILAMDPADGISSARLSRLQLKREYSGLRLGGGPIAAMNPYGKVAKAIPWSSAFALLRYGLTCPSEQIEPWFTYASTHSIVASSSTQPAWGQILVRRLLEAGRTGDSLSTIRMSAADTNTEIHNVLPKPIYLKTGTVFRVVAEEGVPLPAKCEIKTVRAHADSTVVVDVYQSDVKIGEVRVENIPEDAGEGCLW